MLFRCVMRAAQSRYAPPQTGKLADALPLAKGTDFSSEYKWPREFSNQTHPLQLSELSGRRLCVVVVIIVINIVATFLPNYFQTKSLDLPQDNSPEAAQIAHIEWASHRRPALCKRKLISRCA